jgi:hypothetical protein
MTNAMNPILHRIRFWEFVIRNLKILKIHPANGS